IEVAEELFRRIGYAKTAVADIARELGMSPANVYRFFPSKAAINEAIAQKFLDEINRRLSAIVAENRPAAERIERFVLEQHRFNKSQFVSERRMHDMVAAAMEENWAAVEAHIEAVQSLWAEIVADGVRRGEFRADIAPQEAAKALCSACTGVLHPALIAQFAHKDLEEEARGLVRFLLAALTKPTPVKGV
ncbi:MAG: TetR/AcrR family transcriptional regulator, partial [Alphaproteobacteria bacterium]